MRVEITHTYARPTCPALMFYRQRFGWVMAAFNLSKSQDFLSFSLTREKRNWANDVNQKAAIGVAALKLVIKRRWVRSSGKRGRASAIIGSLLERSFLWTHF
jgi:hypothetical protein